MKLNKWNYKKHDYELYEIPDDWNCKTYSNDMREKINCAQCGKKIEFGDSYTSLEIHTKFGFGYCVCEKCYNLEWRRREREIKMKSRDKFDLILFTITTIVCIILVIKETNAINIALAITWSFLTISEYLNKKINILNENIIKEQNEIIKGLHKLNIELEDKINK